MAHIIGTILPAYIAKNDSWDIVDYHKAMNVSKSWCKLLSPTKILPARILFGCPEVLFSYEKLNVYLLAICKGEMTLKHFLHILDTRELFPSSSAPEAVLKTIKTLKSFVYGRSSWTKNLDTDIVDAVVLLVKMIMFAVCAIYSDVLVRTSPPFKAMCLAHMGLLKINIQCAQHFKNPVFKKSDYALMYKQWKQYWSHIKYSKSYVTDKQFEIYSVWD